jgi:hypothetical protein
MDRTVRAGRRSVRVVSQHVLYIEPPEPVSHRCLQCEEQMGPLFPELGGRIRHAGPCRKEQPMLPPVEGIVFEARIEAGVHALIRPIDIGGEGLEEDREPAIVPARSFIKVSGLKEIVIRPAPDASYMHMRAEGCDSVPDGKAMIGAHPCCRDGRRDDHQEQSEPDDLFHLSPLFFLIVLGATVKRRPR